MKLHPFKRQWKEYNFSRENNINIQKTSTGFTYIEYTVNDEKYMRSKEAARCYMVVGNIPMMLNRLYSTINLENFKYDT